MTTPTAPLQDATHAAARAAVLLHESVFRAEAVQWERSRAPFAEHSGANCRSTDHSDPTGEIVVDPARLAVRDVTRHADHVAAECVTDLEAAWRGIDAAGRRADGQA